MKDIDALHLTLPNVKSHSKFQKKLVIEYNYDLSVYDAKEIINQVISEGFFKLIGKIMLNYQP